MRTLVSLITMYPDIALKRKYSKSSSPLKQPNQNYWRQPLIDSRRCWRRSKVKLKGNTTTSAKDAGHNKPYSNLCLLIFGVASVSRQTIAHCIPKKLSNIPKVDHFIPSPHFTQKDEAKHVRNQAKHVRKTKTAKHWREKVVKIKSLQMCRYRRSAIILW